MRAHRVGRSSNGGLPVASAAWVAALVATLLAGLALAAERADAFGTYNILGQNAEHERITRVLQCGNPTPVADCIQGRTMGVVAGSDGTLGAVGKPDDIRELYAFPYAHCDGADFFDRSGYPQTLIQANEHIQRCAFAAFGRLNAAVEAAGLIVEPSGRLRVSETDISDCGFPSATTSSPGDAKTAKCQVLNQFGRALHAIEDFWSHSNWADAANPGTVTIANPPGMQRTEIPDFFRYGLHGSVASANQLAIPAGLITGCDDSSPLEKVERKCGKPGTSDDRVKHSDLNKDRGTIDPRTGATSGPTTERGKGWGGSNFGAAVAGARGHVKQTWADLTAAIRSRYPGPRGAAIVLAISSDTPWTRCRLTGGSPNAQNQPVGAQSSTRSTTVTVQNRTASAFACAEASLDEGEWASLPADELGAGGSTRFRTQTDLRRGQKSVKASASFAIGATGYVVRVGWANPLFGSNSYECDFFLNGQNVTSRAPYSCSRSGGSGNDAAPTFTISTRGRAGEPAPAPAASIPRARRGGAGGGDDEPSRPDTLVLDEDALKECSGYARNFGLHVDDQACDRALNKLARSVAEDELMSRGLARAARRADRGLQRPGRRFAAAHHVHRARRQRWRRRARPLRLPGPRPLTSGVGGANVPTPPQTKGNPMAKTITSDQVVGAAEELDKPEFTRADLAEKLGVKTTALKDAFKEARQSERLEKVRDDEDGKGVFHLTDKSAAG